MICLGSSGQCAKLQTIVLEHKFLIHGMPEDIDAMQQALVSQPTVARDRVRAMKVVANEREAVAARKKDYVTGQHLEASM